MAWTKPRKLSTRRKPLPRKAAIPAARKRKYKCEGGPWDGEHVYLTTPSTYVLRVNKWRGRYRIPRVTYGNRYSKIAWQPAHEAYEEISNGTVA